MHEATEERNYHGVVLSSISRIMRVFTEKIYFPRRSVRRFGARSFDAS